MKTVEDISYKSATNIFHCGNKDDNNFVAVSNIKQYFLESLRQYCKDANNSSLNHSVFINREFKELKKIMKTFYNDFLLNYFRYNFNMIALNIKINTEHS